LPPASDIEIAQRVKMRPIDTSPLSLAWSATISICTAKQGEDLMDIAQRPIRGRLVVVT
jgi:hypothetical protein